MAAEYTGVERRRVPRTPVSKISYDKYGGPTAVQSSAGTCGTGVAKIIPNNPNRVSLLFINNSDTDMYLDHTPNVATSRGLVVGANGGSFGMNVNDEGEAVTAGMYGTCGALDKAFTLIETVIKEG